MTKAEKARRRSRAEYEKLFAEYASSGMTLKAFAESRGIPPGTLYSWHGRLQRSKTCGRDAEAKVVDVRIVEGVEEGVEARVADVGESFEVTIAGSHVISVRPGFDAQELSRLIEVLDPRC